MKKISLIVLGVLIYSFTYSQTDEEIAILQTLFGMEKKAIVAEFVQLELTQQQAFWTLYEEYEIERKELGLKRIDLIKQYAEVYDRMTDEQAGNMMSQLLTQRKANDKLLDTYYKKFAKEISPVVAMQFYQVEGYILTAIRLYILDQIPFVSKK
jgi:hypothetical protein